MAAGSAIHPSLIQGISQQAANSRGTGSCEYQENCLNEVLDGATSRMGSTVLKSYPLTFTDPFVHEINRDKGERYIILIEGGNLVILNRVTGVQATITGSIAAYLTNSGPARAAFRAVTVGDTTFILNRQKSVAMATTKSPGRPNMGCFYFRAGGYKIKYVATIMVGTNSYSMTYETPDNSAPENAQYIGTDQLASQFLASFNSTVKAAMDADGHTGFSMGRFGSTLIVYGPQNKSFTLRTSDGAGDTHLKSFKDTLETVSDLPKKCVEGYIVSVAPAGTADGARYWLRYSGDIDSGRWEEVVKPDTVLGLNANTMPQLLVNTGTNTFEVKPAVWGKRVSGDGERSSPDPSFVGYPIRSLQFISGRLAAVSEYTTVLARARNVIFHGMRTLFKG